MREKRKTAGLPPCLHERSRPIVTRAGLRSGVPAGLHAGGKRLPRRRGPVSTGTGSFRNYPERRPGIAYGGGGQHRGVGGATNTQKHTKHTVNTPAAEPGRRLHKPREPQRGRPGPPSSARGCPPARPVRFRDGSRPFQSTSGAARPAHPNSKMAPGKTGRTQPAGRVLTPERRRSPSAPAGAWPGVRALGPGRGARYFE